MMSWMVKMRDATTPALRMCSSASSAVCPAIHSLSVRSIRSDCARCCCSVWNSASGRPMSRTTLSTEPTVAEVTVTQTLSALWYTLATAAGAKPSRLPLRAGAIFSWSHAITCHSIRRYSGSNSARSISSPLKAGSCSRRYIAVMMPNAPMRPVTLSPCEKAECSGSSGRPVMLTTPLIASPTLPKPGSSRLGPVMPKPVIWSMTRRGFTARSDSKSRPQRTSVAGRMLHITTSAQDASSRASSAPSGLRRSMVTERLLRPATFHQT